MLFKSATEGEMSLSRFATACAGAAVMLAVMPAATAAMMIALTIEEIAIESDRIVHGRVIAQRSAWNDTGTAIHTDVTLAVEATAAGAAADEIVFRIDGGEVDGLRMQTSTAPHFIIGEELVVFLHDGGARERLVGHSQGAFSVVRGRVSGRGGRLSVEELLERATSAREGQ